MKLHPVPSLCFLTMLLIMVLIYDNPIYILSILGFLTLLMLILEKKDLLIKMIPYGLYNMLLIVIINAFVSNSGKTILFKTGPLPVIGRLRISGEAIFYGMNMGVKLFCILMIFFIYGLITSSEDTFTFFSRFAHKLTLIFSMTINIIHRLKIEVVRVKEAMEMRGVSFNEKKLVKRILAYYPLLKVIFISSLEGSIDRAEALHSRHFGKHKRTSYIKLRLGFFDYIYMILSLLLLFVLVFGAGFDIGEYDFYPSLQRIDITQLIGLTVLGSIFIIILIFIWGCMHWKFLKYKI